MPTTGMVELSASDKPLHHAQEALQANRHNFKIDTGANGHPPKNDFHSAERIGDAIRHHGDCTGHCISTSMDHAHLCIETYEYQGAEKAHELSQEPTNKTIAAQLAALIDRIDHGSQAR